MRPDEQERVKAGLRARLQQLRGRDLTDAELADEVAYRRAIPCDEFPVDWSNGPGGGPARNQRMVEAAVETKNRGWQVLVACFPGPQSRGTWDLMRRSKTEGLTVVVVRVPRKGDQ